MFGVRGIFFIWSRMWFVRFFFYFFSRFVVNILCLVLFLVFRIVNDIGKREMRRIEDSYIEREVC